MTSETSERATRDARGSVATTPFSTGASPFPTPVQTMSPDTSPPAAAEALTLSPAKQRLLDVAERLFMERGYAGVTLRDIAAALAIKQASLYYHAPGGKEELYVSVVLRASERHAVNLQALIDTPGQGLEDDLVRVGLWLSREPPLNAARILLFDLPHLSGGHADLVRNAMQSRVNLPLLRLFERAARNGELRVSNPWLAAGAFRAMMQAVEFATTLSGKSREETVRSAVDIVLRGLSRSPEPNP